MMQERQQDEVAIRRVKESEKGHHFLLQLTGVVQCNILLFENFQICLCVYLKINNIAVLE